MTPRTGTPSSHFPESVFQPAEQPCEDRRRQLSGALAEPDPLQHKEEDTEKHSAQNGTNSDGGTDGIPLHSQKMIEPIKVHVDKGTNDGQWRGERTCFDPKAGEADKHLGRIAIF